MNDTYKKNKFIFNKLIKKNYKLYKDKNNKNILYIETPNTQIKCNYIFFLIKYNDNTIQWNNINQFIDITTQKQSEIIHKKISSIDNSITYNITQQISDKKLNNIMQNLIRNNITFNINDNFDNDNNNNNNNNNNDNNNNNNNNNNNDNDNNNNTEWNCNWILTNKNKEYTEYYMITDIIYY